jgi:hypothetical protein
MSQRVKPEQPSSGPSADETNTEVSTDGETPMLAVWITLGVILAAGFYGIYLGKQAPSKSKVDPQTESSSFNLEGTKTCTAPWRTA